MGAGRRTVVTMPGDGIGRIVLPECVRVLDAVGFEADYVHADVGWESWCRRGEALPPETIAALREHRLGIFGAITSKSKAAARTELDPRLAASGCEYFSPILGLRQIFELDVCVRPCRSFAGHPLNFVRRGPNGKCEEPTVDVVVFRQNTEGLYAGVEWTDPPHAVREALGEHPRFEPFRRVEGRDLALTVRLVTRRATRRLLRAAFEEASRHPSRRLTLCEKPNVLRETGAMFEEEMRSLGAEFPEVRWDSVNVDALMMWLTRRPEEFGVIAAGNLFGDVVSDAFAGLVGGMGFACSVNRGDEVAIFEPTHGSAPRYAELDPSIVNPIAAILSGVLLLEHVGETEMAARIRRAIETVVREGEVRTYDMLGLRGGPDVLSQGAATTAEMTEAVLARL